MVIFAIAVSDDQSASGPKLKNVFVSFTAFVTLTCGLPMTQLRLLQPEVWTLLASSVAIPAVIGLGGGQSHPGGGVSSPVVSELPPILIWPCTVSAARKSIF